MRMSPKLTLTVLPLKPTGSSHHADMLQVRVKPGHMTPKKKKKPAIVMLKPTCFDEYRKMGYFVLT